MLKKSDLAKQFELVVKQEIKNYQDSLNFVLQSINELKESVKKANDQALENYAKLHSRQVSFEGELHSLKEACLSLDSRFEKSLRDQGVTNETTYTSIEDISIAFQCMVSRDKDFNDKIQSINDEVYKLKDRVETSHRILNDNGDDLLRRFGNALAKTKKEILEAPSEASLVKKQLEEKLASHTVDVAGIMRELNIYKKENYITQKKIENIYTLIERLREVAP